MGKHTPGPWDYVIADNAPLPHIKIVDSDGETLAVIERLGPRAEADALVLRAAPDLLKSVLMVLDADGDVDAIDFNMLRAAADRAEGTT